MATIQINSETLRAKASEVRSLKAEHDETMSKLKSLVHSLNEQWRGDAQESFVAKFDSMQSTFTNFSNLLEDYAKLMDVTANDFEQANSSVVNRINSF